MRHVIAGTSGHIDHGKTALVKALTGVDADRWEEEKRRGISIDIGFAHLTLEDDVRIGFVDVPGHERFVRNMLAGIGGIDLVLLIIAADESVKPQTREHFEICRLLGIPRGLVVITKTDLVDEPRVAQVREDARQLVAGTFLETAPVIAASARTGTGLDVLRRELHRVALAVPARHPEGHFRLPLDRSFSLKGFGTVVTGTLVSGAVRPGDEVELQPAATRLRVRSVQVYGDPARCAVAGQRTALNLPGIEATAVSRGMVLVPPGRFRPTSRIDCRLELLGSAQPLKHAAPVHFHSGTAEVQARVRLLADKPAMEPGESGYVRLLLSEPLLLLPGDRFILRMFSPVVTIAGGAVLDIAPPEHVRRAASRARLETLEGQPFAGQVAQLAAEARFGVSLDDLVARTGATSGAIEAAAREAGLAFVVAARPWLVPASRLRDAARRLTEAVAAFHREKPLLAGIPKADLRARVLPDASDFLLEAALRQAPDLAADGETIRLRSHSVTFNDEEAAALEALERVFAAAGLQVPPVAEALAQSGVEETRARTLLQILLRKGRLVRVSVDLVYHPSAIERLRELLATRRGQHFSVPEFKDWTGITRKYAIPLLEFLDRTRVTRRVGDQRLVL